MKTDTFEYLVTTGVVEVTFTEPQHRAGIRRNGYDVYGNKKYVSWHDTINRNVVEEEAACHEIHMKKTGVRFLREYLDDLISGGSDWTYYVNMFKAIKFLEQVGDRALAREYRVYNTGYVRNR